MARLGIVLYHGIDSGPELQRFGRTADEAGFESLWVTERYFHEETFSMLGYLAAVTERTKLGLGVANPYTRNPALLAMASSTLDRISGGRFVLGMGRSDRSVIQGRMGIPYGNSRIALREAVGIVRDLTAGQEVTSSDGRFSLSGARLSVSPVQSRVPIYLGGIGPRGLRLAGTIADGVLLNAYTTTGYVRYAVEEVRKAAQQAGRDPDSVVIACMLVIRPSEEPESIWDGLKQRIVRLLAEPYVGEVLLEKGGFDPSILESLRALASKNGGKAARSLITDDMVEAFYLVGPAARCMERVAEYRDAGVDIPLLLPRLDDFLEVAEFARQPV